MVAICAKMSFYEKLAPFMDEKESYKNQKLEQILRHVKYKKVDKGYLVFQEHDTECKEAYVVIEGEVAVIRQPPKAAEIQRPQLTIDTPTKQQESESNVSPKTTLKSGQSSPTKLGPKKRYMSIAPFIALQMPPAESTPIKISATQTAEVENTLKAEQFSGLDSDMIKLVVSFGDLIVRLGYGEIFGQFALQSNTPRSASVLALKETHLMVIHRKEFDVIKEYYSHEFTDRKEFLLSVLPKIDLIADIKAFTKFLNSFDPLILRKVLSDH